MSKIRYQFRVHVENMDYNQIREVTKIIQIFLNIHKYENIIFYQKACFEVNVIHEFLTKQESTKVRKVITDAIEGGVMT